MRCSGCGQTILGRNARKMGGMCKRCRRPALPAPPPADGPAKEETVKNDCAELPMLPEGYRYAYNRTDATFEAQFDGRQIVFEPHEVKTLRSEQAEHIRAHSLITGTLRRGARGDLEAERAVSLGPGWKIARWIRTEDVSGAGNHRYVPEYAETEAEPMFRVPTSTKPGPDFFDRTSVSNYAERPSAEGRPTHVELVRV